MLNPQLLILIITLVSYFLAKKSGADTTEAALVGLAAGGLTYAAIPDEAWEASNVGLFSRTSEVSSDVDEKDLTKVKDNVYKHTSGAYFEKIGDKYYQKLLDTSTEGETTTKKLISEVGETFRSWGALGTAGVITTTKAVTTSDEKSTKWIIVAGCVLAALFLLK